jgi:hypothetical protein
MFGTLLKTGYVSVLAAAKMTSPGVFMTGGHHHG